MTAAKFVIVTGGTFGIGRAITLGLAARGHQVLAFGLEAAQVSSTAANAIPSLIAELKARNGNVDVLEADVSKAKDVERVVQKALDRHGRIDALVNNAAIGPLGTVLDTDEDLFDRIVGVNLKGPYLCSRAVIPHMVRAGGGSIVNIGSISALIVNRPQWQPAYNASKAAVHQLTKSLAAEWAPYDIRVNALAPGYVKTEMAPVDRPEFKARWLDDAPQQRFALPEELAPAVVFLASDASAFMTGSVLVMDGGYTVY